MKRSEINALVSSATVCFEARGWTLPSEPRWDVTDFGLADWSAHGLVLVNLAEYPQYCEKLMYAQQGMTTPVHCHLHKMEDIISRWGRLRVQVWPGRPNETTGEPFVLYLNNRQQEFRGGDIVVLEAGPRITLLPGVRHEFAPLSAERIIGEVSTANDDANDNFFINPDIGGFPLMDEDEPAILKLLTDPA